MTTSTILILILSTFTRLGSAMLAVLATALGIGIAYLVFRFGWSKLGGDMSYSIGGFYLFNTPFKGYHRFRSRKWNMEHM